LCDARAVASLALVIRRTNYNAFASALFFGSPDRRPQPMGVVTLGGVASRCKLPRPMGRTGAATATPQASGNGPNGQAADRRHSRHCPSGHSRRSHPEKRREASSIASWAGSTRIRSMTAKAARPTMMPIGVAGTTACDAARIPTNSGFSLKGRLVTPSRTTMPSAEQFACPPRA